MSTQQQQSDPEKETQSRKAKFKQFQKKFKNKKASSDDDDFDKLFDDIPRPTNMPPMPLSPPPSTLPPMPLTSPPSTLPPMPLTSPPSALPPMPMLPPPSAPPPKAVVEKRDFMSIVSSQSVLAYICLKHLEPRDVVSLCCTNKEIKRCVDVCPELWISYSREYLTPAALPKKVPSTNKEFVNAYNDMKRKNRNKRVTINKKKHGASSDAQVSDVKEMERAAPNTNIVCGSPVSSNMDFQALLERPECKDMKAAIEAFIKNIEKNAKGDVAEEFKQTQNLLIATQNTMKQHPLWAKLSVSHFVVAKEEMHKYIFSRLYSL